jgi:hypothetical protein
MAPAAGLDPLDLTEDQPPAARWQRLLDAAYAANRMPQLFESLGEDPTLVQAVREYWIRLSPALRVEDGRLETPPPEWQVLEGHQEQIGRTLSAVCLLAPRQFDQRLAAGVMGFLVGPRTVLMHESGSAELDPMKRNPRSERGVEVWLGFANRLVHPRSEFGQAVRNDVEARAAGLLRATVVRLEKVGDPGLEAVTIEVEADDESAMPSPLVAATEPPADLVGRKVYVIGYPSLSDARTDFNVAQRILRGGSEVLRIQPGEIIGKDTGGAVPGVVIQHNCFTLGGNGGSPLVDLATGEVLGLHFGAKYEPGPRGLKVGTAAALWPLAGGWMQTAEPAELQSPNFGVVSTGDRAQINQFFSGGFEGLADAYLYPGALRRELDPEFVGRRQLIARIDDFLASHDRGWIVVDGPAGVGKTALLAHLAFSRGWAHHFVRRNDEVTRHQERALRSLAAQIIPACGLGKDFAPGGLLPEAAGRADWFDRLLEAASGSRPQGVDGVEVVARQPTTSGGDVAIGAVSVPRLVLVVDGLDDAAAGPASLLGLPASLPAGVYVIASRRTGEARLPLSRPRLALTLDPHSQENQDDMRERLEKLATEPGIADQLRQAGRSPDWLVRTLLDASQGIWIYLRYVIAELRDGYRTIDNLDSPPADLRDYYASVDLNRQRSKAGGLGAGSADKDASR